MCVMCIGDVYRNTFILHIIRIPHIHDMNTAAAA